MRKWEILSSKNFPLSYDLNRTIRKAADHVMICRKYFLHKIKNHNLKLDCFWVDIWRLQKHEMQCNVDENWVINHFKLKLNYMEQLKYQQINGSYISQKLEICTSFDGCNITNTESWNWSLTCPKTLCSEHSE